MAGLLHKSSFSKGWDEIPKDGEIGICFGRCFEEASYFWAHAIIVITDQPIKKSVSRPDATAHMVKWAIELSQLDIEYKPRIAIKALALADFIAKFTLPEPDLKTEYWIAYVDGFSSIGLGGEGVVIISLEKDIRKYGVQLQFSSSLAWE